MTGTGFRRLWQAALVALAAAIAFLSLAPAPALESASGIDKVHHGLAYFTLAALATGIVARARVPLAMLYCFLLGAALEAAQGLFTAHRSPEWADLAANGAGIALAWLVAGGSRAGWALRFAARRLGVPEN